MLVVFLYVNVVKGIWQSTRLDCGSIDMLFNLLVFASFAKLQHNTESEVRGAVRGCGYLGDAKKMYQNVASHLEQTSKYKYKWQCVHAYYYVFLCVCECHAVWSQLSFRFHLAWSRLLEDHDLWFATYSGHIHPASFYLVAHTSFLGMFAGILHVNPLKLASLHLTVRPICGKLFT